MNKTMLLGNLTKDPDLKYTAGTGTAAGTDEIIHPGAGGIYAVPGYFIFSCEILKNA